MSKYDLYRNTICKEDDNDYILLFKDEESAKNVYDEFNQKDQRIAELEEELAELKENAIVPKFYYKDIVYYIENVSVKPKIVECMVTGIVPYKHKKFYSYEIESLKSNYYCVSEENIFATKEEAMQKLKELEGKLWNIKWEIK